MPHPSDAAADHLPLNPVVLEILLALGGQPLHGYAVAHAVRTSSQGRVRLETGPLYRHLKRLLDDRLIEEAAHKPADDDARRGAYYRLTPLGRQVVAAESGRLSDVVTQARRLGLAGEPGQ